MILSETVEIRIGSRNQKHYKALGYDNTKCGEIINVKVEHLTPSTDYKINVKCDICSSEKWLSLCNYNVNIKKHNIYCCSEKCSRGKAKKTMIELYGVDNYSQTDEHKERVKKTCIEKYNVPSYSQTDEYKEKTKKTCLEKYNVDCFSKTESHRQNISKKFKGVKKTELHKENFKKSIFKKYGSNSYLTSDEFKIRLKEEYGVSHTSQIQSIQKKGEDTCFKNYGVKHNAQNEEMFKRTQLSGFKLKIHKETGLSYRGTFEKNFLDFCFSKNIQVKNAISIRYLFENKEKVYFPDFYLNEKNLIIEIKSNYYFEKYKEKNLAKQKACLEQGYNFIFIIDKKYNDFLLLIKPPNFLIHRLHL